MAARDATIQQLQAELLALRSAQNNNATAAAGGTELESVVRLVQEVAKDVTPDIRSVPVPSTDCC